MYSRSGSHNSSDVIQKSSFIEKTGGNAAFSWSFRLRGCSAARAEKAKRKTRQIQ